MCPDLWHLFGLFCSHSWAIFLIAERGKNTTLGPAKRFPHQRPLVFLSSPTSSPCSSPPWVGSPWELCLGPSSNTCRYSPIVYSVQDYILGCVKGRGWGCREKGAGGRGSYVISYFVHARALYISTEGSAYSISVRLGPSDAAVTGNLTGLSSPTAPHPSTPRARTYAHGNARSMASILPGASMVYICGHMRLPIIYSIWPIDWSSIFHGTYMVVDSVRLTGSKERGVL